MHTDEQHEPSDTGPERAPDDGLRRLVCGFLAGVAARLREALGADSLGPEADVEVADLPARPEGGPSGADPGDGELTVSRVDGRLRVSDGDTYIESDTWEEAER